MYRPSWFLLDLTPLGFTLRAPGTAKSGMLHAEMRRRALGSGLGLKAGSRLALGFRSTPPCLLVLPSGTPGVRLVLTSTTTALISLRCSLLFYLLWLRLRSLWT